MPIQDASSGECWGGGEVDVAAAQSSTYFMGAANFSPTTFNIHRGLTLLVLNEWNLQFSASKQGKDSHASKHFA